MKQIVCVLVFVFQFLNMFSQSNENSDIIIDVNSCPKEKQWNCYKRKFTKVLSKQITDNPELKQLIINATEKDTLDLQLTFWLTKEGRLHSDLFGASLARGAKSFKIIKNLALKIKMKEVPKRMVLRKGKQVFVTINYKKSIDSLTKEIYLERFFYNRKKKEKEFEFSLSNFKAPVYPGCCVVSSFLTLKDENINVRQCMSQQISSFIAENFDTSIVDNDKNYRKKKVKIQVAFKVDKKGKIVDIKPLSLNSILELESKKVIKQLPTMKPGSKKNGEKVGVLYTLPIVFNIL